MPKYPKSLIQDISDLWAKCLELERRIKKLEKDFDEHKKAFIDAYVVITSRVSKLEKVVENGNESENSER